jgi:predicted AAA+ superfamily ATPase
VAIEVKATRRVSPADLRGLAALEDELELRQRIVVSMEPRARTTDEGVQVLPVDEFFRKLWADEFLSS